MLEDFRLIIGFDVISADHMGPGAQGFGFGAFFVLEAEKGTGDRFQVTWEEVTWANALLGMKHDFFGLVNGPPLV
jgi:hypothetical protein